MSRGLRLASCELRQSDCGLGLRCGSVRRIQRSVLGGKRSYQRLTPTSVSTKLIEDRLRAVLSAFSLPSPRRGNSSSRRPLLGDVEKPAVIPATQSIDPCQRYREGEMAVLSRYRSRTGAYSHQGHRAERTGEIWCAPNPLVRVQGNWTMGREKPAVGVAASPPASEKTSTRQSLQMGG